jgi:hypothetical protein
MQLAVEKQSRAERETENYNLIRIYVSEIRLPNAIHGRHFLPFSRLTAFPARADKFFLFAAL